jgi:hypothetical protein
MIAIFALGGLVNGFEAHPSMKASRHIEVMGIALRCNIAMSNQEVDEDCKKCESAPDVHVVTYPGHSWA